MPSDLLRSASGERSLNDNAHPMENPGTTQGGAGNDANGDAGSRGDQNGDAPVSRSGRPTRACTVRAAARLQQQHQKMAERRPKAAPKKESRVEEKHEEESPPQQSGTRAVTTLVEPPPPAQLPRWSLRCMWELASVLNFFHVFRSLLNISVEFSAEEFETALLSPNDTLGEIHMPLLKAIPPVTRMAHTHNTWITVLCRKLKEWWHWVAEGELPIVASHGAEIEVYKSLDPSVRVVILKALCDIRVEQEDIRNYIENSMKHGIQLTAFRKERIGGDTPYGVHYWYEDDPIIGHRLYREIRKAEVKKVKTRGSQVNPNSTYQWETLATNLDEFQDISEKLFTSYNRTEVSLGKKLKNDMLPEIEKVHKRKERLLKKQHREALLLDSFVTVDGLAVGRSLRDRKPVTYTFDDYDRSINEAIKITKRQSSPEFIPRREGLIKNEAFVNGEWNEGFHVPQYAGFSAVSPNSPNFDDVGDEHSLEQLDRSNRQRRRPQRYSEKDFVEAVSDMELELDSDDDIVGEAVYDEEYLRKRKQRKLSSSSEGDEEYHMDEDNAEDEEEDSFCMSDDSDGSPKLKKLPGRTRRETKIRLVRNIDSGLRRSKRTNRNCINYRQYDLSESDNETAKPPNWKASNGRSEASESPGYSNESHDLEDNDKEQQELKIYQSVQGYGEMAEKNDSYPPEKSKSPSQGEVEAEGVKRGFLDLNELAPGSGFDDGPNTVVKNAGMDDF